MTVRAAAPARTLPLLLAGFALVAVLLAGFVVVAPNRLLSGTPLGLLEAAGAMGAIAVTVPLAAILALAFAGEFPARQVLLGSAGGLVIVASVAVAGLAASSHAADAGRLTRVSLGAGFWCLLAAGFLIMADAVERTSGLAAKAAPVLATGAGLVLLAASGTLSELSLSREFAVRRHAYLGELGRHLELTAAGLVVAVVAGTAIGLMAYRRPQRAGAAFAALNIVQTIPSIALFALLIGPLTALTALAPALRGLGVGGIGPFPAILALALYGLLPVARGVHAGLSSVPKAAVDAARGMGMTGRQIFTNTLIPLALPTFFQTLRVTLVQLIGLATLAALIGAGGLGTFIFRGLGQTANDLVLLGALSAIGLALLADIGLRALAMLLFRRPAN
ncbi:ABC transporter permease [Ancylobacter pratisalsi]|uniref:ABC transporter permease n=1 Tax=Ancylobacter pratisalsi TaxID=1745854 RepID=A0A6P1YMU0_9HYPH|nr:ABC transporter permease [Ancylobacter pratisalsi]QIB34260.1 ABC transporter permease [Ancylobacter pratisalsi]